MGVFKRSKQNLIARAAHYSPTEPITGKGIFKIYPAYLPSGHACCLKSELTTRVRGEPYGDITVRYAPHLHGTEIGGAEIPNIIDEIPVLAVAAAFAQGTTTIRDAAELRVKESDRIATTVGNLRAMGAAAEEHDDGMCITGGSSLHGTTLQSFDDHRIAMSFLMAGLNAEGATTLQGCRNIATSYPGFEDTLRTLLA